MVRQFAAAPTDIAADSAQNLPPAPLAIGSLPASARDALRGRGEPLAPNVRARMERGFGTDFGSVRVHTGAEAVIGSLRMGALGFAAGERVAMLPGSGDRLLAHELAHVVQHRRAAAGELANAVHPETEAHGAARVVAGGGPAPTIGAAPGGAVQRFTIPSQAEAQEALLTIPGAGRSFDFFAHVDAYWEMTKQVGGPVPVAWQEANGKYRIFAPEGFQVFGGTLPVLRDRAELQAVMEEYRRNPFAAAAHMDSVDRAIARARAAPTPAASGGGSQAGLLGAPGRVPQLKLSSTALPKTFGPGSTGRLGGTAPTLADRPAMPAAAPVPAVSGRGKTLELPPLAARAARAPTPVPGATPGASDALPPAPVAPPARASGEAMPNARAPTPVLGRPDATVTNAPAAPPARLAVMPQVRPVALGELTALVHQHGGRIPNASTINYWDYVEGFWAEQGKVGSVIPPAYQLTADGRYRVLNVGHDQPVGVVPQVTSRRVLLEARRLHEDGALARAEAARSLPRTPVARTMQRLRGISDALEQAEAKVARLNLPPGSDALAEAGFVHGAAARRAEAAANAPPRPVAPPRAAPTLVDAPPVNRTVDMAPLGSTSSRPPRRVAPTLIELPPGPGRTEPGTTSPTSARGVAPTHVDQPAGPGRTQPGNASATRGATEIPSTGVPRTVPGGPVGRGWTQPIVAGTPGQVLQSPADPYARTWPGVAPTVVPRFTVTAEPLPAALAPNGSGGATASSPAPVSGTAGNEGRFPAPRPPAPRSPSPMPDVPSAGPPRNAPELFLKTAQAEGGQEGRIAYFSAWKDRIGKWTARSYGRAVDGSMLYLGEVGEPLVLAIDPRGRVYTGKANDVVSTRWTGQTYDVTVHWDRPGLKEWKPAPAAAEPARAAPMGLAPAQPLSKGQTLRLQRSDFAEAVPVSPSAQATGHASSTRPTSRAGAPLQSGSTTTGQAFSAQSGLVVAGAMLTLSLLEGYFKENATVSMRDLQIAKHSEGIQKQTEQYKEKIDELAQDASADRVYVHVEFTWQRITYYSTLDDKGTEPDPSALAAHVIGVSTKPRQTDELPVIQQGKLSNPWMRYTTSIISFPVRDMAAERRKVERQRREALDREIAESEAQIRAMMPPRSSAPSTAAPAPPTAPGLAPIVPAAPADPVSSLLPGVPEKGATPADWATRAAAIGRNIVRRGEISLTQESRRAAFHDEARLWIKLVNNQALLYKRAGSDEGRRIAAELIDDPAMPGPELMRLLALTAKEEPRPTAAPFQIPYAPRFPLTVGLPLAGPRF